MEYLDKIIEYEENIMWNNLSTLLTNTSESVHMLLTNPIMLETKEDFGLCDLEKIYINEIWQDFREGIITFKVEGYDEELDLSDYPELVEQIYDKILDELSK